MWFQVKVLKQHMEDHDDGQSQDDTAYLTCSIRTSRALTPASSATGCACSPRS